MYLLKVRLGQQAHTHGLSVLGKHNGILSQAHGARLKPIAIEAHRNMAIYSLFVTKAKT